MNSRIHPQLAGAEMLFAENRRTLAGAFIRTIFVAGFRLKNKTSAAKAQSLQARTARLKSCPSTRPFMGRPSIWKLIAGSQTGKAMGHSAVFGRKL
jgi:hypothetical protein